jgi:hypothetical protein
MHSGSWARQLRFRSTRGQATSRSGRAPHLRSTRESPSRATRQGQPYHIGTGGRSPPFSRSVALPGSVPGRDCGSNANRLDHGARSSAPVSSQQLDSDVDPQALLVIGGGPEFPPGTREQNDRLAQFQVDAEIHERLRIMRRRSLVHLAQAVQSFPARVLNDGSGHPLILSLLDEISTNFSIELEFTDRGRGFDGEEELPARRRQPSAHR